LNKLHNFINISIGSAFGLGLSPLLPGSCGAVLGVILYLPVVYYFPFHIANIVIIILFMIVSWLNHILTPWAVKYYKNEDPSHFVLDEVAGFLVIPIAFATCNPIIIATYGFLILRILDAIKLPPANFIDQNLHGPYGILLDDVVSALYTVVVLNILLFYFSETDLLFFL